MVAATATRSCGAPSIASRARPRHAAAALVWAAASEHHSDGSPRVPGVLLVVTAVAWGAWLASTRVGAPPRVTWLALAVLAGVGGAVGGLAPVGIAIAVIGAASLTITVLVAGSPHAIIAEGLLATAAAVLGGASRRQHQDRAAQAEQLLAERMRADAERDRAAALAERNRIGREVHDVLAHSLGALCVQLDAADALLETGGDPTKARQLVQHARRLAVDGLGETRTAVHALRAEPIGLTEQLTALAATVISAFKEKLFTGLFPGRKTVPKPLIFAKDDSHADDIVQLVREVFGKDNEFATKITYRTHDGKPDELLQAFRNSLNPRIVVTVDMIATGTDVKPLECLLFHALGEEQELLRADDRTRRTHHR